MISFLHAADLHLGMRTTRFDSATAGKIREARFAALDNLLGKARNLSVDFVIIAGDLFDHSSVDFLTARRAHEMLAALPMPVYVLPGNHDPLLESGVWDRSPWNAEPAGKVILLRESMPQQAGDKVMLFPCPVRRRTCMDDPTSWIAGAPPLDGVIRIAVAHGSLKTRDDLPLDDHLIARHAAEDLGLDYLALGHWHGRRLYADRSGIERTAYPGVHEPMRFQGAGDHQTGWAPYSAGSGQEFLDDGKGEILHVRISARGAPPSIEPIEVGHYHWQEERRELNCKEDLDRLIHDVATRPRLEARLLRLRVAGVLDAESMLKLEELREILSKRYLLGELEEIALHVHPSEEEVLAVAGQGVLNGVLEKLRVEVDSADIAASQVAGRAIVLLYQIAKEVRE